MLTLHRRHDQEIIIEAGGEIIVVQLIAAAKGWAKFGFKAEQTVKINRKEIYDKIQRQKEAG